jgi:hypothetical protein
MKLALIALGLLAWPLVTWWVENQDPDEKAVVRMADRDRKSQAVRPMSRRMQYAQIVKPALLQQHGRPARG